MDNKEKMEHISHNEENPSILEEKIGNTQISFSEVIKLYHEIILNGKGDKILFKKDDLIALDANEKNKFQIKGVLRDLYYDGELVYYYPIVVTFKKDTIEETYKIFTEKYLDKIYKKMNFNNPFIIIGNIIEKYEHNQTVLFTRLNINEKNFIIYESEEMNFKKHYSKNFSLEEECDSTDLTRNFNYYFSSPKKTCKMKFYITFKRSSIIRSLLKFKDYKIHSIFGPYGNGKTTSLIIISKAYDNICYLNLKALYRNKNNFLLWKYELFLFELYNLFKNEKNDMFDEIKKSILACNHFWEAISLSINFCINKKKRAIFILDQYKESIDPKFEEFQKIKTIINDIKNIYVQLIVSSSINNQDIRKFIIKKYIDKISPQNLINNYYYLSDIFQLADIEGFINTLSNNKRKIFEEYFSNIPSYFYSLLDSAEDDISQTFENIKNRIKGNIDKFYKTNKLTQEDFAFIIQNYPLLGIYSVEDKNIKIHEDKIKKFIQLLPIKYFHLEIKDEEIINISFYFKLAKICFLEFIIEKLFELLEQPKLQIPERAIGDLLEAIVIENLKNNRVEKFDQCCEVDTLWDIQKLKGLDTKNVLNNNILITTSNDRAKYIDFGILLKGKTLILAQCKKALAAKPNEYVTISKVISNKKNLLEKFQKHFGCEIEKIKLIYLTGIYFTDKENNKYYTWSRENTSFKKLEEITNSDKIPLVLFDVQNKEFLIKNNETSFKPCSLTRIDSIIYNEENYNFVLVDPDKAEIMEIYEGLKNHLEKKGINILNNTEIEEKSENKKDIEIYRDYILNREIIPNKRFKVKNPDYAYLNNEKDNILTTFKINGKKCFSYYDSEANQIKHKEIINGVAKDLKLAEITFYLLRKKTLRSDE